jgi:hypothetical protein
MREINLHRLPGSGGKLTRGVPKSCLMLDYLLTGES